MSDNKTRKIRTIEEQLADAQAQVEKLKLKATAKQRKAVAEAKAKIEKLNKQGDLRRSNFKKAENAFQDWEEQWDDDLHTAEVELEAAEAELERVTGDDGTV